MPSALYTIELDYTKSGNFEQTVKKNIELRAQIFDLAQQEGQEVYFHRYVDNTVEGAPRLLLECTTEFLGKVKALPLYGDSREWKGAPTFRAGHAGPVNPKDLARVLAQETTDPSLPSATWRLQDDILDLALSKSLGGHVLVRHVDGDCGFISLLCPESFVDDVKDLPRCRAAVKPADAAKFFHNRGKGPKN
jgi:hypothetical protein